MSITSPRPRDFLHSEVARLRAVRDTRHHEDPATQAAVLAAYNRRIDRLLEELAAT